MSSVDAQPPPSQHNHHQRTQQELDTNIQKAAGESSPVAPAYSPITPKVQPVLPATTVQAPFVPAENGGNFTFQPPDGHHPPPPPEQQQLKSSIAPTEYIPQPPNLPFSSDDATDAIALRAAISTLQFQKMKARDDLKTLESIKQLALDDPNHFKTELAAGRLNESRPRLGDLRAILDEEDDEDEDDEEEDVKLGASREDEDMASDEAGVSPEKVESKTEGTTKTDSDTAKSFPRIPGPQSIVRMPPVNWDKYGIAGEPLESMHAQQRRWPGSNSFPGQDKGREHTIAAPYSPFLDTLDANQRLDGDGMRKDSGAASSTPPGTISEHPMETRSRG